MFTLPSMWNLVISTIAFSIAAWYIHRYMNAQGIPKGMARGILAFTLSSLISWGVGEGVDWAQDKIEGQPTAKPSDGLSQLLKEVKQAQP